MRNPLRRYSHFEGVPLLVAPTLERQPAVVLGVASALRGSAPCRPTLRARHGRQGATNTRTPGTLAHVLSERVEVPIAIDDDSENTGVKVAGK